MTDPIVTRLDALASLDDRSRALVAGLTAGPVLLPGAELVQEAATPRPRFLAEGWAARLRILSDGRRQIISFLVPGDGLGLCAHPRPLALATVVALTPVTLKDAAAVARAGLIEQEPPALARALHLAASLEEAELIDQVVRLGRQTAVERLSHLLLELRFRLSLAGLVRDDRIDLPLTQEQLADATGLSAVHVNRTLQLMRRDGLIELSQGALTLLRPETLRELADYREPTLEAWAFATS